jgi:Flp pilus assembly protein TadD
MRAGDAAGAAEAYRGALRLTPSSPELQVGLARALNQAGDRQGAIAAYRAALALSPGRQDAARELAQLDGSAQLLQLREAARSHFGARRFAEAERAYQQLTVLVPQEAGVFAGHGACLLALGRRADAVAEYRRATELAPTNAGFFAALGASQEAAGDTAGARASYQRATSIDPNQRAATQGLARLNAAQQAPRTQPTAMQTPPRAQQPAPAPPPPAPPPRAQQTPPAPGPDGAPLPEIVTREELVRTLAPLEHRLEECAPRIDATVSFRLRIRGADGGVAEASVVGDLAGTSEATCMEGHLSQAHFPRFSRSQMEVTYPFELRGRLAPAGRPR